MKTMFVFGTRPEAIKMAPVIHALKEHPSDFDVCVCVTAQHRQMLDQVLAFFEIKPDYDLDLMQPNQTLFDITAKTATGLRAVFEHANPDHVLVQGDTTTAFMGALASYYAKVPVSHIEAGLRSNDKFAPFPEEMNRILAGRLADYHFAPTERARNNLAAEGITDNVWVVGNTVIDALLMARDRVESANETPFGALFEAVDFSRRIILVTGHRRESFGEPFEELAKALRDIVLNFSDVELVYPVHLNPNVQRPVNEILGSHPRIHLMAPVDYPSLVWLMNRCTIVITDSGGIQEEAPALGKPVLVMRDVTERTEGVDAGTAKLVGTDREKIISETSRLLTDNAAYDAMATAVNPYGDGKTRIHIREILAQA